MRADVFVSANYPEFSRSSLDGLFGNGQVTLSKHALKSSYKIKVGDVLNVDDKLLFQVPPAIELPVLYEDDQVIVIDKPAGVLTHSKGALNNEATVASFIEPKLDGDFAGSNRAGIVHRLDRATSGVIITAKTPEALQWLQKQFSARKTKKTYLAIVEGVLEPTEAIIDAPIARNPKKPQTFYVNQAGKPAQTEYKVLETFTNSGKSYSLLKLKPRTGRTHQIRIHLSYNQHPVVGDRVYGTAGPNLLLHARSLELTLPNHERKVFEANTPEYFEEFISDV